MTSPGYVGAIRDGFRLEVLKAFMWLLCDSLFLVAILITSKIRGCRSRPVSLCGRSWHTGKLAPYQM